MFLILAYEIEMAPVIDFIYIYVMQYVPLTTYYTAKYVSTIVALFMNGFKEIKTSEINIGIRCMFIRL